MTEDLKAIDKVIRLEYSTHDRANYVRMAGAKPSVVKPTRRERLTFLVVSKLFRVFKGTFVEEDIANLWDKFVRNLAEDERRDAETLATLVGVVPDGGTKSYVGKEEIADALLTATIQGRYVRYRYRSASAEDGDDAKREESGVIAPVGIRFYRNGMYVAAARVDERERRAIPRRLHPFAVERFRSATIVPGETFARPDGIDADVDALFAGPFGVNLGDGEPTRVVIDFAPRCRAYVVERTFHESQEIERRPDGGVRLMLVLTDLREVARWVMHWGGDAWVSEPPELRAAVRAALQKALDKHPDEKSVPRKIAGRQ
jgi:predicted DNA-binding transcriptional regulator YafY